ncbi:M48 family metalloprotease [Streptomyces griseoviridis]|nr:M48 family metalloprotease [Streptomyces niveoruber]
MPYDRDEPGHPHRPKAAAPHHTAPDGTLPPRTGRIHITARQRGADLTVLGGLALHLPHLIAALAVVLTVSYVIDAFTALPWWLPFGCWSSSGALTFHRPSERLMARWLFGLRHPTPEEVRAIRPVWREVTARAGVDGAGYQLWVEDADDVNAMAAAGHIVGVTSHSLRTLPPDQLAGVLAHELGHHTRGHAWASLLVFWYTLPGRIAWRLLLRLAARANRLSTGTAAVLIGILGAAAVALATATYGLVLLPVLTPYLAAAVSRRAELRADEHAAGLGFARQLMNVLSDESERTTAAAVAPARARLIARLLSSHPDVHTRLHHLQERLDSRR